MPLHCPAAAVSCLASIRHRACTPGRSQSEVSMNAVDVQVRVPSLAPQHAHAIVLTGSCSSVRQKPAGDRASCPARSVGQGRAHAFVCRQCGKRPCPDTGVCNAVAAVACDRMCLRSPSEPGCVTEYWCMCFVLEVCATTVCSTLVSSRRGRRASLAACSMCAPRSLGEQHHCMVPMDVEYVSRVVACGRNFYIRTLIWM